MCPRSYVRVMRSRREPCHLVQQSTATSQSDDKASLHLLCPLSKNQECGVTPSCPRTRIDLLPFCSNGLLSR